MMKNRKYMLFACFLCAIFMILAYEWISHVSNYNNRVSCIANLSFLNTAVGCYCEHYGLNPLDTIKSIPDLKRSLEPYLIATDVSPRFNCSSLSDDVYQYVLIRNSKGRTAIACPEECGHPLDGRYCLSLFGKKQHLEEFLNLNP